MICVPAPPSAVLHAQIGGAVDVDDGAARHGGVRRGEVKDGRGDLLGRVATRPNGLSARRASPLSPWSASRAMSVSVNPGATAVTEMPRDPRVRANDCPKAISPALLAP